MSRTAEILEAAAKHHSAGRLPQAEKLYREVLAEEPGNADAIHALGVLAMQRGAGDKALELLGLASSLRPDDPAILNSLGLAYRYSGKLDEAEVCLKRAVSVDGERHETWNNLADLALQRGEVQQAIEDLRRAIELKPDYHRAHFNLGNAYAKLGDHPAAIEWYERAAELDADDWQTLGNLGLELKRIGAFDKSEICLRRAALLDPGNPGISLNLSSLLIDTGRFAEAEKLCREVVTLMPSNPAPHNNLGLSLLGQGRLPDATLSFLKALTFNKEAPEVHFNLGNALRRDGKIEQAIGCFDKALAHAPDFAQARYARATARLLSGDLGKGWEGFEARRRLPYFAARTSRFEIPEWTGESLEGKRIIVYPEGDARETILLLRFTSVLKSLGAHVVFGCPPIFEALCKHVNGIDELHTPQQPLPDVDLHASLDRVAALLCKDVNSIPASPYIRVDEDQLGRWKERLENAGGRQVGFMWKSDTGTADDPHEDVPLAEFEGLFGIEGCRWCSLQYSAKDEDIERLGVHDNPEDLSREIAGPQEALACIASLDLLITTDTAAAHLAGAAGIPAWVLLSSAPGWCWTDRGERTPWYPSLKVFRREFYGPWSALMNNVAEELVAVLSAVE